MPFLTLAEFHQTLPQQGRLLGFDLGTKTIGLAISDSDWRVASPLETIKRKKFSLDVERVKALIVERDIAGLVFGWPVHMDGSEGPRCQATQAFARNLTKLAGIHLPMLAWDERMSTQAIERLLIQDADMTRRRRAEVVDKMAAAYILQGALDGLRQASFIQTES